MEREIVKISPMKESDLFGVGKILDEVFNKSDATSARNELLLHFKSKKAGIEYGHSYWVARADGQLVGIVGLEYTKNTKNSWLSWFAVKKRFQRKQIGKKLLDYAIEKAKKSGIKMLCIECGTLPMFGRANDMYKRRGFKNKFMIENFWSKGDHLVVVSKKI